jgi:HEAT repeat protein
MKKPLLFALLAALLAAGVYVPEKLNREVASPADEAPRPSVEAGKPRRERAKSQPLTDPAPAEDAAAVIQEAVITYSPAGVRALRPFLHDPDPAIRRAARDGLVQLGEADAVPFLREAALQVEDPEEIVSLREAADLLALPAWSDSAEAREVVAEMLGNEGS